MEEEALDRTLWEPLLEEAVDVSWDTVEWMSNIWWQESFRHFAYAPVTFPPQYTILNHPASKPTSNPRFLCPYTITGNITVLYRCILIFSFLDKNQEVCIERMTYLKLITIIISM